jgi:hypothetical protein
MRRLRRTPINPQRLAAQIDFVERRFGLPTGGYAFWGRIQQALHAARAARDEGDLVTARRLEDWIERSRANVSRQRLLSALK